MVMLTSAHVNLQGMILYYNKEVIAVLNLNICSMENTHTHYESGRESELWWKYSFNMTHFIIFKGEQFFK